MFQEDNHLCRSPRHRRQPSWTSLRKNEQTKCNVNRIENSKDRNGRSSFLAADQKTEAVLSRQTFIMQAGSVIFRPIFEPIFERVENRKSVESETRTYHGRGGLERGTPGQPGEALPFGTRRGKASCGSAGRDGASQGGAPTGQPSISISTAPKTIVLNILYKARTRCYANRTCRLQNPNTPRAGREGGAPR